jgi:hypothetical protein
MRLGSGVEANFGGHFIAQFRAVDRVIALHFLRGWPAPLPANFQIGIMQRDGQ